MDCIAIIDSGLYAIYWQNDTIWRRKYNGTWSNATKIIEDVLQDFSANLYQDSVEILCSDVSGLIKKVVFDGSNVTISENLNAQTLHNAQYWVTNYQNLSHMIYTIPALGHTGHVLVSQTQGDAEFSPAVRMDGISPICGGKDRFFKPIFVADGHHLIFYQLWQEERARPIFGLGFSENKIAYREIFHGKIGRQNIFFNTHDQLVCCAFLATKHSIHGLFASRGMFGYRLVYKNIINEKMHETVLAEGPQIIHNTAIYIVDGVLHLAFMQGDALYTATLEEIHTPVVKLASRPEKLIKKAKFLAISDAFLADEVLVHKSKPWEILLFDSNIFSMAKVKSSIKIQPCDTKEEKTEEYDDFFDNMEDELRAFGSFEERYKNN